MLPQRFLCLISQASGADVSLLAIHHKTTPQELNVAACYEYALARLNIQARASPMLLEQREACSRAKRSDRVTPMN